MADFHQMGPITTLHCLRNDRLAAMERDLSIFSRRSGIGLVLPALYAEFERPAMRRITQELREAGYLSRIVVAIGRATEAQVQEAWEFFRGFRSPVTLLWMESPGVREFFAHLERSGLNTGQEGKGRACWLSFGYLLAEQACGAVAVHDCDIANYTRLILANLCYPVAQDAIHFEFCKGYYARAAGRLHGRVTRLFLAPLLRALELAAPGSPLLSFLTSFRYPLAGEFAIASPLLRRTRMPADWGFEIGMLTEVFRNTTPRRVCQTEVTENYDHKHQALSPRDPARGLRKMAADIGKTLLRAAAAEGIPVTEDRLRNLQILYERLAEDMVDQYQADAIVNGLPFDRHQEESMILAFSKSLRDAMESFLGNPAGAAPMPSWNRVESAVPGALDWMRACGIERPSPARMPAPVWNPPPAADTRFVEEAV
jgi:glucosyl-3-phosphoglycerate synthase